VPLALPGQRNPGLFGNQAPVVAQFKLDGMAGCAPNPEDEAVAAAVELASIAEVVAQAGAIAEITCHADDAAGAGAVSREFPLT